MTTIRKAAEQSLEQVRERINARESWVTTMPEVQQLLDDNNKQETTIDTLLDVIDAYEAEHQDQDTLGLYTEVEAAKATAIERLKG